MAGDNANLYWEQDGILRVLAGLRPYQRFLDSHGKWQLDIRSSRRASPESSILKQGLARPSRTEIARNGCVLEGARAIGRTPYAGPPQVPDSRSL